MRIPAICGLIDRRILVNYRVTPDVLARLLPSPFRPKLVNGMGMAGVCLIRLKHIRPRFLPALFGISSENAAHRIAVEWDHNGETKQGVFVPRRDTSSRINTMLGGRLVADLNEPPHSVSIPPETEELDIGEVLPIRVLKNGLWLLEKEDVRFAVLLAPTGRYGEIIGIQFQVGIPNSPAGTTITQEFFRHLEASILRADIARKDSVSGTTGTSLLWKIYRNLCSQASNR